MANEDSINIVEACKYYPFICRNDLHENAQKIQTRLRNAGISLEGASISDSSHSVAWMVNQGMGISVIPALAELRSFPVKMIKMTGVDDTNYYYLHRLIRRKHSDLEKEFWEYTRKHFADKD